MSSERRERDFLEEGYLTPPSAVSREEAQALLDILEKGASEMGLSFLRQDARPVKVSASLAALLHQVLEPLAQGDGVSVIPVGCELSPRRAAELLHVSRQYVTRLLEAGKLPSHRVGTHRRVRLDDVLLYKRQRDAIRHEALSNLREQSEELGLYPELE